MHADKEDKPQLDVLAVGAHPDDVEITCGGTLARLVQQGYSVGIVDLTDGEPTPNCPSPDVRIEEARQAADTLGIPMRKILDLPNRRLFDCFEARVALAIEIRKYRPRLVLGFGGRTRMASPDHWQAMQITDAAIFYARLTKWEETFEGLPVHTVEAQLHYAFGFDSLEMPPSAGHFVADISDTLETKMAAIGCYKTQFPPAKAGIFDRIRAAAHYFGVAAGFSAGELFLTPKTLGSHNIMQTIFPAAD
jgi:bacillithiol biosynthesis deacetylase BshB1